MQYDNDAKELKYKVLSKVAELCYEDRLEEKRDQVPYDIIPGPLPTFRCCIYREREIIRERVTAACGQSLPQQVRSPSRAAERISTTTSARNAGAAPRRAPITPFPTPCAPACGPAR